MQDEKHKEKNSDQHTSDKQKQLRRNIKFQSVTNKTKKRTVSGENRKLKTDTEKQEAAESAKTGKSKKKSTASGNKKKPLSIKVKKNWAEKSAAKKASAKGSVLKGKSVKESVSKGINKGKTKISSIKQDARKAELFKKYLIAGGAVVIVLILILLLAGCPGKKQKAEADSTAVAESEITENIVPASEIRHFSFGRLISDEMAGDGSVLTVSQFRQVLQELYDANYILVDVYRLAEIQKNEDGSSAFAEASLDLPPGKIPFVLSQRDVNYSLDRIGKGYASRMILDENNKITNEYLQADGNVITGAYDLVPILDEFIAEHPDFAYENARGVLGLTGYNGILGYRTSDILGKTMEEGNPFAVYGTFDVQSEIEACKPVIEALKNEGWHFACFGNNYCSYGAEYAMMTSDVDAWMENVSDLIGGTDLMLFPCDTDIGNWSEYQEDNPKYQYLKNLGFNYYFIETLDNPYWLQIRPGYVRQGIKEIENYNDFASIMGE